MKKMFPIVGQLLLVSYIVMSHFEIPMNDFVAGVMLGTGIVGVLYGVTQLKGKKVVA